MFLLTSIIKYVDLTHMYGKLIIPSINAVYFLLR